MEARGRLIVALDLPERQAVCKLAQRLRTEVGMVKTGHEALRAGATWIVVGRPILQADDPVAASRAIVHELGQAG